MAATFLFACACAGHAAWSYPPSLEPRDASGAIYDKPCGIVDQNYGVFVAGGGDFDGDPGGPRSGLTKLSPGWVTMQWQESIAHQGSPFRISLSEENCESADCFNSCILLDHIPHDDTSAPCGAPPCTPYTNYKATVRIPDVYCNRCVLQLIMISTQTLKPGDNCTYSDYNGHHPLGPNGELIGSYNPTIGAYNNDRRDFDGTPVTACPAAYHSCANVVIDGRKSRKGFQCEQPPDWPYRNLPLGIYFVGEKASWTPDRYLASATPSSYNQRGVSYGLYDNQSSALVAGPYAKGARADYYRKLSDAPSTEATAPSYESGSVQFQASAGYLALEDTAFANRTAPARTVGSLRIIDRTVRGEQGQVTTLVQKMHELQARVEELQREVTHTHKRRGRAARRAKTLTEPAAA